MVLGTIALVAAYWGLRYVFDYRNGSRFDQEVWLHPAKGDPDSDACVRGAMVGDLRSNYLRTGTPQEAVETLLGPPDGPKSSGRGCQEYLLGMCSGFQIDYDGLTVCFDENAQLTKSYTLQH